jgi:hypothetical protein
MFPGNGGLLHLAADRAPASVQFEVHDLEVDRGQFDDLVRIIRFGFGKMAVAAGADFRRDDSGFLRREHLLPVPRMAQFPSIGAFLFLPGFFLFGSSAESVAIFSVHPETPVFGERYRLIFI